jgi:hypothetical protein
MSIKTEIAKIVLSVAIVLLLLGTIGMLIDQYESERVTSVVFEMQPDQNTNSNEDNYHHVKNITYHEDGSMDFEATGLSVTGATDLRIDENGNVISYTW